MMSASYRTGRGGLRVDTAVTGIRVPMSTASGHSDNSTRTQPSPTVGDTTASKRYGQSLG
jgi:hypothetical protein